jgi:beta-lactamase regulating signal transducer with metallopeptidase domain
VIAVWAGGAAFFISRMVVGKISLRQLLKKSNRYGDGPLRRIAGHISETYGIRQPVALIRSDKCAAPFTCKVLRPVVVLPSESIGWSIGKIQEILYHELSHIKRKDYLTQSIARSVCSIFWFVPVVWIAYLNQYLEQEKSCDICVINKGIRPNEYATHILEMVKELRGNLLMAGVFGVSVRKNMLEKRISNVMNQGNLNGKNKNYSKMKVKTLLVALVLLTAVLVLFTGGVKEKLSLEEAYEIISGTWINEDYNSEIRNAKFIIEPDGTSTSYPQVNSDISTYGHFTVTDSIVGWDGTIWMKVIKKSNENLWEYTMFEIVKISNDKKTAEVATSEKEGWYGKDYPAEIIDNTLQYTYYILYRQ